MTAEEKLEKCFAFISGRMPFRPKTALVLGSGLGAFADEVKAEKIISYREIPDFPVSTVAGHKGRFVFCHLDGVPLVIMQGRVHYYEGYEMQDVVLPVRLMRRMGAEILLLTNAAGGLNTEFRPGDLMMITDQIGDFVPSPLHGPNIESLGKRFPDMSHVYDPALRDMLQESADSLGTALRRGVYIQLPGPGYETPAEVRMCRLLGADAVGMSTACEAVAAAHCGFRTAGISCITNLGCGLSEKPLSHEEVQKAADQAAPLFKKLLLEMIRRTKNA